MGGWSQARYQRHTENYHIQHAKEVVDALARVVRDESIGAVVIAGDDVIAPLLKDQLPKDIAARVIDIKLEARAPEHVVLERTIAALRDRDRETDRESVDELIGAYRAGGLAVAGVEATRKALDMGQVDELIIAASPAAIAVKSSEKAPDPKAEADVTAAERTADELVAKARQTSATIRFIEDPALLSAIEGVGALLRFK
jgi:peptide subunit release factor 1 (eRF1)